MEASHSTIAELADELAAIEASCAGISDRMQVSALRVAAGQAPEAALIDDLARLRQSFQSLRGRIGERSEAITAPSAAMTENATTNDFRAAIERLIDLQRQTDEQNQVAGALLNRVASLRHVAESEFAPLTEPKAEARRLKSAIAAQSSSAETHQEAVRLRNGSHPLAQLLALVDGAMALDNQAWESLMNLVTAAYGKNLALAAARGQLTADVEPNPEEPTPSEAASACPEIGPTEAVETPTSDHAQLPERKPEIESLSASDRATPPPDVHHPPLPPATDTVDEQSLASSDEESGELAPIGEPEDVTTRTGALPIAAIDDSQPAATLDPQAKADEAEPAPTDVATLAEEPAVPASDRAALFARLARGAKFGLAFHLRRSDELRHGNGDWAPPAWLFHALALSPHVRYDVGELSAMLRGDLAQFDDALFSPGEKRANAILRFFLIAACLRPALLAPSTGAAAVLDQVRLKDGLSSLTEYVRAVAAFGHGGHALDAQALKQVKAEAVWQAERDELRREVGVWLAQAPTMRLNYAAASYVWRDWTEQGGVLAELLRPIVENIPSTLEVMRRESERLSDDDEVRRLVDETDKRITRRQRPQAIRHVAYNQLRRHEQEAVSLAKRWLALHHAHADRGDQYRQEQAERIREEVWSRQDAVLAELESSLADARRDADGADGLLAAAVTCCLRAVESLATLFDPAAPLTTDELPAAMLVHADLLRIPALPLTQLGEPASEPAAIGDAIAEAIADGLPTWETAFATRRDERDHEATDQVLNYLAAHPEEADGLSLDAMRQEQIKHLRDCRQTLLNDADESSQALERAMMHGLIEKRERDALNTRVEQERVASRHALRFNDAHERLRAIREVLQSAAPGTSPASRSGLPQPTWLSASRQRPARRRRFAARSTLATRSWPTTTSTTFSPGAACRRRSRNATSLSSTFQRGPTPRSETDAMTRSLRGHRGVLPTRRPSSAPGSP